MPHFNEAKYLKLGVQVCNLLLIIEWYKEQWAGVHWWIVVFA